MSAMKLGPKLTKLLELRGWSQEKLREAMREPVSSGTVSNWCAGRGPLPRIDQAFEISKLLDCDLMYLADEEVTEINGTRHTTEDDRVLDIVHRLGYEESFNRLLRLESPLKAARVLSPEESRIRRGE